MPIRQYWPNALPTNTELQEPLYRRESYSLDSIHNNDWAMYAGVEFGNSEYSKALGSVEIIACKRRAMVARLKSGSIP